MKKPFCVQWMEYAAEVRAAKRVMIVILTKPIIKMLEWLKNVGNLDNNSNNNE